MTALKEITVFSVGDSNELSTWSNVPFFFTKSLEEKNIKVNRVNIEENTLLHLLYKYSIYAVLKLIYKNNNHSYFRSGLNYFLTNRKIRRAIKEYDGSDAFIFLTYSFSIPSKKQHKIILFSDWSYLYMIRTFLKREPYWFERKALNREEKHINAADFVLSLFPGSKAFNTVNYKNECCDYLGNVINSSRLPNASGLSKRKLKSAKILFIGNKKYIEGAFDLISAFTALKKIHTAAELAIIGLNEADTGIKTEGLIYHGYLDKGEADQNTRYYELLSDAKVVVNTTSGWGAFSAMTEAMYYYTPVITTAYGEFVNTYGNEISFGYFVHDKSQEELISTLERMLNCPEHEYVGMMNEAHNKVKEFTWQNYSEKLLNLIS